MAQAWRIANGRELPLKSPTIMGIVNVTPDSFADGGRFTDTGVAVAHAERLIAEGAAALDIGGESTRPGAARIDAAEQIRRVVPVIAGIRRVNGDVVISVDTTLEAAARAALDAGADAINDVSGGADSRDARGCGMFRLAAERRAGLVIMHRLVSPEKDSYSDRYAAQPAYADVVAEVSNTLAELAREAIQVGVRPESVVVDPGLGFGKSVDDNLALIRRTDELIGLGFAVMSALSRKSFVGRVGLWRDSSPDERLAATLALSRFHASRGARLFRVHDVKEHREVLGVSADGPRK